MHSERSWCWPARMVSDQIKEQSNQAFLILCWKGQLSLLVSLSLTCDSYALQKLTRALNMFYRARPWQYIITPQISLMSTFPWVWSWPWNQIFLFAGTKNALEAASKQIFNLVLFADTKMSLEATFKQTAESFSKEINQTLTNDDLKDVYGLYKQVSYQA